ncbi:hypothetical protein ACPPVW_06480 [Leifsonia sp. McL0607]|uniref:hypothetical protein n=1 Tax=Leifsonia sp. McL0607 TaxID=3415672 RepID=UPI003CF77836
MASGQTSRSFTLGSGSGWPDYSDPNLPPERVPTHPVDPGNGVADPGETTVEDFFTVRSFEGSPLGIKPFETVRLDWTIETTDASANFGDFTFRVYGNRTVYLDDVNQAGSGLVSPLESGELRLQGSRRGRHMYRDLASVHVDVDTSECTEIVLGHESLEVAPVGDGVALR